MSVNNLNNHHLTEPEINAILNALNDLERAMELLNINLTPEDRNKYGRVDEQNKLFINKVHDFATQQTNLRTMDVDWDEFEKDFKSRAVLENIISRLNNLSSVPIIPKFSMISIIIRMPLRIMPIRSLERTPRW